MSQGFYGFPNILGLLRATNLRVTGKAGATAGAGLAGGTTSGAPSSGSFDVGEGVFGQDGSVWICTASGSPGTFVQAGFANPLTTKADLLVGGTAGAASRLGVGSNGQVLTADSTQTLGLKFASGASGATTLQLDYAASTDLANGLSLASSTWTDIGTNQSFTVSSGSSVVEIATSASVTVVTTSGNHNAGVRLVLDSAGTPVNAWLGGAVVNTIGQNAAGGTGPISVTGLAAGSHTVKLQVYIEGSAGSAYCRASTLPNVEGLHIRVFERT